MTNLRPIFKRTYLSLSGRDGVSDVNGTYRLDKKGDHQVRKAQVEEEKVQGGGSQGLFIPQCGHNQQVGDNPEKTEAHFQKHQNDAFCIACQPASHPQISSTNVKTSFLLPRKKIQKVTQLLLICPLFLGLTQQ